MNDTVTYIKIRLSKVIRKEYIIVEKQSGVIGYLLISLLDPSHIHITTYYMFTQIYILMHVHVNILLINTHIAWSVKDLGVYFPT